MPKRIRRSNPDSEHMLGAVDGYVRSAANAVDMLYERRSKSAKDIASLKSIESRGGLPPEGRRRLREEQANLRELNRQIALFNRTMLKSMGERLKRIEDSPLAKLRSSEIRQLKFEMARIKAEAKVQGSDVRVAISEALGSIVTLEKEMSVGGSTPGGSTAKERRQAKILEYWKGSAARWKAIRKHAVKHPRFYIRGSDVVHKKHGFGKAVEYDGRRVTIHFDKGPAKKATMDEVIPAPVHWVDKQFESLGSRMRRGEEISKEDIERIIRRMKSIHDVTKPRARLRTYAESNRALKQLIGKIQTRLTGDKMDKAEADKMMLELEDFQRRISSADKSTWSKVDQRQWASDVSKVRKAIVKASRKKNPCVGFHFHGKDADELLKALEASASRQGKLNKNPGRSPSKKKATKKKASKKKSRKAPTAKQLNDKCFRLWEAYRKKPAKKRLQAVLDHLEKMKASKAKSVKEERASCLRVANKEARRLGMK